MVVINGRGKPSIPVIVERLSHERVWEQNRVGRPGRSLNNVPGLWMKRWVQLILLLLAALTAFGSNGRVSPFAPEEAYNAYGGAVERLDQRLPVFYGGSGQSAAYQVTYGTLSAATVFIGTEFGQAGRVAHVGRTASRPQLLLPAGRQPVALLPENAGSLAAKATTPVGELRVAGLRNPTVNRLLQLPATDPALAGTRILGYTTPDGRVFLQPGLSREQQVPTLRHESVHAFFTPQGSGPVATFRQSLGQWGYDNSQLLRFTEEAIAETYASGNVLQGLRHPFVNGYVSPQGVILEGAGLIGVGYLGYQFAIGNSNDN